MEKPTVKSQAGRKGAQDTAQRGTVAMKARGIPAEERSPSTLLYPQPLSGGCHQGHTMPLGLTS